VDGLLAEENRIELKLETLEESIVESKERIFKALDLKQPDRVPVNEWQIDPKVREKICPGMDYCEFVHKVGLDALVTKVNYIRKDLGNSRFMDEWGITRVRTADMSYYPENGPLADSTDIRKLKVPSTENPIRYDNLENMVRSRGDKAVVFMMDDVFIYPTYVRGMENLLMDFYDNPEFVEELTGIFTEFACKVAANAIEIGADIVAICDDYAFNSGLLFSKDIFRRFILPNLKKLVATIRNAGAYCVKHTDGNIWDILPEFIDCGIQGIQSLDPSAGMNLANVKKTFGDRICLLGNVDCGSLLCSGSREEVEEAVIQCIRDAAGGGGYILQSSNTIHSGVKPENFIAMLETARKYGIYDPAGSVFS